MQRFERTVSCGLINEQWVNKSIFLIGWVNNRRDFGSLIFVDLRDRTGIVQLIFNPDFNKKAHELARSLRPEFVIQVHGRVVERDAKLINSELPTGQWEVQVDELVIINTAKTLPFSIDESESVSEELRLTYRYLDLRNLVHLNRFILRNKITFATREFFYEHGFLDVATPVLTKNAPEGAREFIVPSRINKGSFYALPQSPQLYKQLLMCAGFERYFQLAPCFRDEDLRADRQPEFTQLDIEMSFVNEIDVQTIIEQYLAHLWKKIFDISLLLPFDRMTYDEAFAQYGSDKPDLRFELPITDCSSLFHDTKIKFLRTILGADGKIGAIHVPEYVCSRSELDAWEERATQLGAKGLLWIRFRDGQPNSRIAKFLPNDFMQRCKVLFPMIDANSVIFIIAGSYAESWQLLGRLRLALAQKLNLIKENLFKFCWITDFPLFEYDEVNKRFESVHHPFTSPKEGWQELPPEKIKARAYDIVLNGIELGGGSIRIFNEKVQAEVFKLLGLSKEEAQQRFGFLLKAMGYGFPPHGGIAIGFDRLAMIMAGASSIREVIAFPKTQCGVDLMMNAPSPVSNEQLAEYGLEWRKDMK